MRRLWVVLAWLAIAAPVSAQWITQNGISATRFPIRLIPITQPTATVLEGTVYYDSASHLFKMWNGTAWISIGSVGAVNLGTTSTDGQTIANTTPANGTTTVQISPRTKWCGTAWNSTSLVSETDCMFFEVLPATVAGTTTATLKIGYINTSGTVTYPATLTSVGGLTINGVFGPQSSTNAAAGTTYGWNGRTGITSTADKLFSVLDSGGITGTEINNGSATLGTCTGGTITTGSHNFAGGYTGNTSSSCVINFGTPNWTNAPFCVAMSIASTTHPRVSATAASSITITGGVSGEAITYLCSGRIGT